jgi:dTMP kinase
MIERLKKRKKLNRYDKFSITFYNKVQKGFLNISKKRNNKYLKVNSNLEINSNKKIIINKVKELIT